MAAVEQLDHLSVPLPTRDLEQAKRDLDAAGYCIVSNVLSLDQISALRSRLTAQASGEKASGVAWQDYTANQRVFTLINKGRVFRDIVMHPIVTEMMGYLLGSDFLVSSMTANIAGPGGNPMYLHSDQQYIDFWTPTPMVANICWMLDDFSDENGGTRLVPGSHLWRDYDRTAVHVDGQDRVSADVREPTIAAEGPAGSALIFDGRLIHGTGSNHTSSHRHAILTYCCRPFMRQQENFFLALDPALEAMADERLLERIGYKIQYGLGRIETPTALGILNRRQGSVSALDAHGKVLDEDFPLPTS